METCCTVGSGAPAAPTPCPACGEPGRLVEPITLKAMLRPEALARLGAGGHRFCRTAECPVVYFHGEEAFRRDDVLVPVFQKERQGERTVCYCFAVRESQIRREIEATGRSASADRIKTLVQAERCACEVRNPQGSCCLGNVSAVAKAVGAFAASR